MKKSEGVLIKTRMADGSALVKAAAKLVRDQCHEAVQIASAPRRSVPASDDLLEFYRDFVGRSRPCVFKAKQCAGADAESLLKRDGIVKVSVTPNGRADAECGGKFYLPAYEHVTVAELLDDLSCGGMKNNRILYASNQNDCLRQEGAYEAMRDIGAVDENSAFDEIFGAKADARNIWIGDARSVTSIHRDFYENVMYVCTGAKIVKLLPPSAVILLREAGLVKERETVQWVDTNKDGHWTEVPQDGLVEWVASDWECRLKEIFGIEPAVLTIHAGEALYLPCLWYHEVSNSETGITIALNSWWDMDFEGAAFRTLSSVEAAYEMKGA